MGTKKRLQLTHTVLYAKGWYEMTNCVEDLKKTLNADGYMPSNKKDVMLLLVARLEDAEHHRISAFSVLNDLDKKALTRRLCKEEYTHEDLVIDYCMELMLGLDNLSWDKGEVDYNILPKRKH